jgi:regulator of protease activity HflC (stomatin/prohibitin superfamily)
MAKILLFGSLGLGVFILSLFLILSLDSLDYNTVGLNYSSIFKSIESETYESGFHFIGLGHDFIAYDLKVNTMEFSKRSSATLPPIVCRTKDGLKLQLEISFQYKVNASKIYNVYTTFGEEWKNILLRVAIDSISDTSTNYSSLQFFTDREDIGRNMSQDLNTRLLKDLYSSVVFFQLRSIDLPNDYEDAIQKTEVTKQAILLAEAARNKNKVL